MDALEEVGGGELTISITILRAAGLHSVFGYRAGPAVIRNMRLNPFFTTKPVGKGTGLGLSTCYGIIRQHEGDITCGNRLEGGAYFTIFVPAVAVASGESGVPAAIVSEPAG